MNRRFKLFHNIAMRAMYFYKTYHKFKIFYKTFALNNCSVNSYNIISSYLPSILRSCMEISRLSTLLFIDSAMTETVVFTEPRKCSQNRTLFGRDFPRNSQCVNECFLKSPQRVNAFPCLASTGIRLFIIIRLRICHKTTY